jgi:hypothetical protein
MERHNKNFYLFLLAYVLVEIRAAEDGEFSSKVADTFHNVPEALTLELDEERDRRLYEQIMVKAEVHGITHQVKGWEATALQRCKGINTGF